MNIKQGFTGAIGNTPLIRLNWFSEMTGCEILGKAEFMNPGGSVKDRAALEIISRAEQEGRLQPGGTVVEGTAGNTGIGLTHICNARGYKCIIVIPETQSQEKLDLLATLGADVRPVPAVPYKDDNNFQKIAGRLAAEMGNAIWANQFDNTANRDAHFKTTGPEIWTETDGKVDAIVSASGTGGTLGGLSLYMKSRSEKVRTVLADPTGAAMFSYVKTGVAEVTGPGSISEGIGNTRVTANFQDAPIDDAYLVTDQECVDTVYQLLHKEGLMLGGSSGINVTGAVKLAREMGPGHTIVTILCDGGQRYMSRLFNARWLAEKGLVAPEI